MNLVIIGNVRTNGETIKKVSSLMIEAGINVRYPTEDDDNLETGMVIQETFERIDWCDFALAIPKEGITFGISTTYELTYARKRGKPVLIYYG